MARQGRRLCDPGPGGGIRVVDVGVVFERGRAAALRDGATAVRPRLPANMSELLISPGPGEWRAAWVENDEAVELYVERGDTKPPGSIHLGRVVRMAPGLDAVLVDIGDERPALLRRRDAAEAELTEGARVLVRVRREAWADKAP